MVGSPDLNLLLSRYVRLAEFTPDAESSRPLDARRDSLLWLMRSAKILFNAVDVRMCSKGPSKCADVREGPRLLGLTSFAARSTLAVECFAIGGFVRYRRREKNGGEQSQATPCPPKSAERQAVAFSQRFTCTIDEACEATGLGRTKLYELIGAGHLATTTVGRRRLVAVQSLLSLLKANMST
jgi:excisionase family DNA binding protein